MSVIPIRFIVNVDLKYANMTTMQIKQKGVMAEERGDDIDGELTKVKKTILLVYYTIQQKPNLPVVDILSRCFAHLQIMLTKTILITTVTNYQTLIHCITQQPTHYNNKVTTTAAA